MATTHKIRNDMAKTKENITEQHKRIRDLFFGFRNVIADLLCRCHKSNYLHIVF